MIVIWLSGHAGAGKDTVAAILCKKYDLQRVAFADSLKDFVAVKYGIERGLFDTPEGKIHWCPPLEKQFVNYLLLTQQKLKKKI
ncbi:MAG: hypothetical protein EBY22_02575 [Gammaproteobacteria bacterium]|nr:hypothetical protein [Gammaproteobacteria bacterium]